MNPANFPSNKKRKQDEATIRQARWTSLELSLQLAELDRRPGHSMKQRARILAAMTQK